MVGFLLVMVIVMLATPVQVGSVEDTQLRVYLVEADTGLGRSGIEVAVAYDDITMTKSCGFRGQFYCWFNLGSYTGIVRVTTGATLEFESTTTTVSVQPGQNEVTMKLYRQEMHSWSLLCFAKNCPRVQNFKLLQLFTVFMGRFFRHSRLFFS